MKNLIIKILKYIATALVIMLLLMIQIGVFGDVAVKVTSISLVILFAIFVYKDSIKGGE